MLQYQKSSRYVAQVGGGMEEIAAAELVELGAQEVNPGYRVIDFGADRETLYRITYCTRLVTRVLAPLISFSCHSTKYLYKTAQGIDWSGLFGVDQTFAIFANVANSKIRHSRYASLCLKDAIVDQFRDRCGKRPSIDSREADVWLNLHIHRDKATISFDVSGRSLHKRGYRASSVEAPMQETVAAAIIAWSEWDGAVPLYDPMCGSGTLLCEALMRYARVPSGYLRPEFGFRRLPDYDDALWRKVKERADAGIRDVPKGLIAGSDMNSAAVKAARENISLLPHGDKVAVTTSPFQEIGPKEDCAIVCNPPYGLRLESEEDASALLKEFGDFLKQQCTGSNAFVYFGVPEMLKKIGLRTRWKKPLSNGGLDGRLAKYELFRGEMKKGKHRTSNIEH